MATVAGRRLTLRAAAAALACVLALAVPAPAHAVRTLGVSEGVFEIALPPGGTFTGQFYGENAGDEDLPKIYVYAADIRYDERGNVSYVPVTKDISSDPATTLTSGASWVHLSLPAETKMDFNAPWVSLAVGEQLPVGFTVSVPDKTPPGDYGVAVFLEMGSVDASSTGSVSAVSGRIGSRLRIRVLGEILQDFRFDFGGMPRILFGRDLPLDFLLDNRGNIGLSVRTAAELKAGDRTVQDLASERYADFYLPAATAMRDDRTVALDGWQLGPRDVEYSVTYYDEEIKRDVDDTRTARVVFLPWPLLAAAFALVLLAGAVGRYARYRRKRGEAALAADPLEREARAAAEAAYRAVRGDREGE